MKDYILTLLATITLSALCAYISPKEWAKYIKLICGLVITVSLIMPVTRLIKTDWKLRAESESNDTAEYKDLYKSLVLEELEKRISEDVSQRIKNEFGQDIKAQVSLDVNDNNEIERVKEIKITGGRINNAAKERLYEVYGAKVTE